MHSVRNDLAMCAALGGPQLASVSQVIVFIRYSCECRILCLAISKLEHVCICVCAYLQQ